MGREAPDYLLIDPSVINQPRSATLVSPRRTAEPTQRDDPTWHHLRDNEVKVEGQVVGWQISPANLVATPSERFVA